MAVVFKQQQKIFFDSFLLLNKSPSVANLWKDFSYHAQMVKFVKWGRLIWDMRAAALNFVEKGNYMIFLMLNYHHPRPCGKPQLSSVCSYIWLRSILCKSLSDPLNTLSSSLLHRNRSFPASFAVILKACDDSGELYQSGICGPAVRA